MGLKVQAAAFLVAELELDHSMDTRQLNSTVHPIVWLMVDATNHVEAKLGLIPTVTISKDGAPFTSPVGAVMEIGSGWYKLVGNATDRDTLGELIVHASASGADPSDMRITVVEFDPFTDVATIAAQVGPTKIAAEAAALTASDAKTAASDAKTAAEMVRKCWQNRLELVPGNVNNWVLYDDDSITPLLTWSVTGPNGEPIIIPVGASAKRDKGH